MRPQHAQPSERPVRWRCRTMAHRSELTRARAQEFEKAGEPAQRCGARVPFLSPFVFCLRPTVCSKIDRRAASRFRV
jgi:hypothetical protein